MDLKFTPLFKNRAFKTRFFSLSFCGRVLILFFSYTQLVQSAKPELIQNGTTLTILIKMIPEQEKWFQNNVLITFTKRSGTTVMIKRFERYAELDSLLANDSTIDVVKVPMERAESFRDKGYIEPISSVASPAEVNSIRSEFLLPPLAVSEKMLYFVPRKLETRIVVYRISKVKEAVEKYQKYKPELDRLLKKFRGNGLPPNFILESDPSSWDYFDVLMAGFVWMNENSMDKTGKVGHRGKNYSGTFLRLIDRAFQFGAIRGEIAYLNSKPVVEALLWEGLYSKIGIYNSKMYRDNWTGSDLWKGFGDNSIYLSFLTQLDCFFLIGTGENGLNGYVSSADDIDFAVMPAAVSLSGEEFMLANRNITTGGWFWGISDKSTKKSAAFELIKHITSDDNQKNEFEAFGVLSARKSLLVENRDEMYLKRWRNRMLQTSIKQLNLNRFTFVPTLSDMERLQNAYYRVLYKLCVDNNDIYGIENALGSINRLATAAGY